jgi:hypothetical protein
MIKLLVLITLLAFGCTPVSDCCDCSLEPCDTNCTDCEVVDYSQYDAIIKQDLNNKQNEVLILREIKMAQDNNDTDAYEFFMQEYFDIPRLELTETQKKHPKYKAWLTNEEIKSGVFMTASYNYE